MPVNIGVGIWEPGDRTKMKPYQAAMYRAERDALRRRYQIKFAGQVGNMTVIEDDSEAVDGEITETVEAESDNTEDARTEAQMLMELGYN